MGKIMAPLDKFDLVTPMLTGAVGGTADYGEAADEAKKNAKKMKSVSTSTVRRSYRPNTSMLT